MYITAHIYKDKYMVQDFMRLLEREQDDECTHYGSKSGSLHIRCQSRSSIWSRVFKWKVNCVLGKEELKVDWVSDEEINQGV
jgi:hypothetical protein